MRMQATIITCDQPGCAARLEHQGPVEELAGWLHGQGWAATSRRYYCPAHRGERRPLVRSVPAPREAADDAALRARAAAGDRDAFAELVNICRQPVYRYVYHRCGHRELAEDITQETLARAWRRVGSYREMGRGFGAWLTTIASNLLVDHWKSGWWRYAVSVDMHSLEPTEPGALRDARDPVDPVDAVMDGEAAAAVRDALADLTGEQREVVELRFFAGLSIAETAQKMGKAEGAVKAAQYRAVRVLARHPLIASLAPWAVAAA